MEDGRLVWSGDGLDPLMIVQAMNDGAALGAIVGYYYC